MNAFKDMLSLLKFEGPKIVVVGMLCGGYILCGKRRDNGKWTHPGGHMDDGEDIITAAIREVKEETGLDVKSSQLEFVSGEKFFSPRGKKEIAVFCFLGHIDGPRDKATAANDPDKEVSEWKWVDLDKTSPELQPDQRHAPEDFILIHLGIQKRGVKMSRTMKEVTDDIKKANTQDEAPTATEPVQKTNKEMNNEPGAYMPDNDVTGD